MIFGWHHYPSLRLLLGRQEHNNVSEKKFITTHRYWFCSWNLATCITNWGIPRLTRHVQQEPGYHQSSGICCTLGSVEWSKNPSSSGETGNFATLKVLARQNGNTWWQVTTCPIFQLIWWLFTTLWWRQPLVMTFWRSWWHLVMIFWWPWWPWWRSCDDPRYDSWLPYADSPLLH